MNRIFRLFVTSLALLALFFVIGSRTEMNTGAAASTNSKSNSGLTFDACWTQWSSGPCKAIFRDANYKPYICGECDSSGNPKPGKCNATSDRILNSGYWCS